MALRDTIRGEADELQPTRADPDSRARTHLANERTFLAWLRTGITLLTLGLAAAQFLSKNLVPGVPIVLAMAIGLVSCGIFVALSGALQYFRGRREINEGRYRSSNFAIVVSTIVLMLVGVVAIVFIFLVRHGS
jgi:putative membrane protein